MIGQRVFIAFNFTTLNSKPPKYNMGMDNWCKRKELGGDPGGLIFCWECHQMRNRADKGTEWRVKEGRFEATKWRTIKKIKYKDTATVERGITEFFQAESVTASLTGRAWCKWNIINSYITGICWSPFSFKADCKRSLVLGQVTEVVRSSVPTVTLISSKLPNLKH